MNDEQWIEHSQQGGAANGKRERAALAFLRERLPDYAPFTVWASFQFLSLDGALFEVDALVFSPAGVFLVELATQRGALEIGAKTWLHTPPNGSLEAIDNPLRLARRKADHLDRLLESHVKGKGKGKYHTPPIQAVVFLAETELDVRFDADAATGLFFQPSKDALPSILDALIDGDGPGLKQLSKPLNSLVLERFEEVVDDAGFDAISRTRRLGDYNLGELLDTTEFYQDYVARHVKTRQKVRARIFHAPRGAGDSQLERIREAARREYAIVSELKHPSILPAHAHIGHRARPAVLFEHPQGAVRLDHYIQRAENLSAATRFKILESVAEAIRYAHQNRVLHRALSPQSVLVIPGNDARPPQVRVYNWHTGQHDEHETGTRHIADYLHDTSRLFLAPELGQSPHLDESADVFGLGALAFYLFTGEPPARDLPEYIRTIFEHGGLRLTSVRDAVSPTLDALVFDATRARPGERLRSVTTFLARLSQARASLVAVGPAGLIDPLEAAPGTIIADQYKVLRRLGSGATATAFLVACGTPESLLNDASLKDSPYKDSSYKEVVLKVANDDAKADRLQAEADALRRLEHRLIVSLIEVFEAGGRTILALQNAGVTFRDRLRDSRALSLDEIRRFGTDLCHICQALEDQSVFHRDIKPANLGIGVPSSSRQHLMLFDFSLAGVAIERIDVGTPAYRDPFLATRRSWDAYADRYSAALVLYEMATQQLPTWGDGRSNPATDADAVLHLAPERFPAAVRDSLIDFFNKALARDHHDRFDNALEMSRQWEAIFERTLHSDHGSDGLSEQLQTARPNTSLATLGISQVAIDVLDGMNVTTVRAMLERSPQDFSFMSGVSDQVRTQLRELRNQLAELFPSLAYGSEHHTEPVEPSDLSSKSVDHLLEYINGKRSGTKRSDFNELIAAMTWPADRDAAIRWPDHATMRRRTEMGVREFEDSFRELRAQWLRKRVLEPLRDDIIRFIDAAGGAISSDDLSREVLGHRGSVLTGRQRMAAASLVTHAAVEAELGSDAPRLQIRRREDSAQTFVGTRPELLQLLGNLGALADRLAAEDPLASPERAYKEISALIGDAGLDILPRHRALSLAAAASNTAARSPRDELYPRDMPAERALTLCANILLRQAPIDAETLRNNVHDRYPEAQKLPDRPELDQMLSAAGVALKWDTSAFSGHGAFVFSDRPSAELGISRSTRASSIFVSSTSYQTGHDHDRDLQRFEERLGYKSRNGGFFALMVSPKYAPQAPQKLAQHYDLQVVSVEEVFLRHIKARAEHHQIPWSLLAQVDSPNASESDRQIFANFLSSQVLPGVREELLGLRGRVLLINPGLLAHWRFIISSMTLLDDLRDSQTHQRGAELVWLLTAADAQFAKPHIDKAPVPVLNDSEYIRIPSRWLNYAD